MTWFLHIPINVFFLEKSATMDGDLGGWARKKSCDINEGPGYIYCISGWNKVSILCCVYCTKLYVYPWQKFKMVFFMKCIFFGQISNNDCINMYIVNFLFWLYAWLTFFSGCIYGLNFILVYRITDKNIKYNGDGTSSLWRRYSEFELLQNYLSITYPYIVVPPLPEKKVSTFICTHSFIQITGF